MEISRIKDDCPFLMCKMDTLVCGLVSRSSVASHALGVRKVWRSLPWMAIVEERITLPDAASWEDSSEGDSWKAVLWDEESGGREGAESEARLWPQLETVTSSLPLKSLGYEFQNRAAAS